MEVLHHPALLEEVCKALLCHLGGLYVDCTLGTGGHTLAILNSSEACRVIAFDFDNEAIDIARERLSEFTQRIDIRRMNFKRGLDILAEEKNGEIDGILMDLGLSSLQLKSGRGFSFRDNESLDMRMDMTSSINAMEWINHAGKDEISDILFSYGEEKMARNIAKMIVEKRRAKPFHNASELANEIEKISCRIGHIHPATKTFQAIRIFINRELEDLDKALETGVKMLKTGGRIAVISYHSLEDRIVKNTFKRLEKGCICPPALPECRCGIKPILKSIFKKPVIPSDDEIKNHPTVRSAKLRVGENI